MKLFSLESRWSHFYRTHATPGAVAPPNSAGVAHFDGGISGKAARKMSHPQPKMPNDSRHPGNAKGNQQDIKTSQKDICSIILQKGSNLLYTKLIIPCSIKKNGRKDL